MKEYEGDDTPTVLIVEDEVELADLYATWVGRTYAVEVAYDYETALDLIDETLDVALLDRQLPDGSGDDLLAEIRRAELDCRVAMVTAVEPGREIVELGFDEYIQKPVSSDELRDAVDRLLLQGTYRDEVGEFYRRASESARRDTPNAESDGAEETQSELASPVNDIGRELSDVAISLSQVQRAAEYQQLDGRSSRGIETE